jgi:hypothetical protein
VFKKAVLRDHLEVIEVKEYDHGDIYTKKTFVAGAVGQASLAQRNKTVWDRPGNGIGAGDEKGSCRT